MIRKLFHDLYVSPILLKDFFLESVSILKTHLKIILWANFLFSLTLVAIHFAIMFYVFRIAYERSYQNLLLGLFAIPFTSYMMCGMTLFYLDIVHGVETTFWKIYLGHKNYFVMLLFSYAYYALYNTLFLLAFELQDHSYAFQVRIILGLLLFVWLLARLAFTPIFIVTENLNIKQAFKRSFLFTSGKTTITIMFTLSCAILIAVGVALLFVGVLYFLAIALCIYILLFDIYAKNEFSKKKVIAASLDFRIKK